MSRDDDNKRRGNFERVSLEELVGSSPAFAEQVRRSRDVLEGSSLVRRMREMADGGAGISQEELARRLGLSQARISAIEKGGGAHGPTYELLKRVARACGVVFQPDLLPQRTERETVGGDMPGIGTSGEEPFAPFRREDVAIAVESAFPSLTARQRDVLTELAKGQSNREIAAALGLQEATVKIHVRTILKTLGAADRSQAIARARDASARRLATADK